MQASLFGCQVLAIVLGIYLPILFHAANSNYNNLDIIIQSTRTSTKKRKIVHTWLNFAHNKSVEMAYHVTMVASQLS